MILCHIFVTVTVTYMNVKDSRIIILLLIYFKNYIINILYNIILKSFIFFYMSHDHVTVTMTCVTPLSGGMTVVTVMYNISYNSNSNSKSQIKIKIK